MLHLASCQSQSQHNPKMPVSSQRFLRQSSHTGTTLRPGSLSYIAPWLFTKDTIKSSSTSCYCLQISQTNCFWCQQERFKLSGMKRTRINSANVSLGGNATEDPLGKCGWEKEQGWGTFNFKNISPKPHLRGVRLPCSSWQLQNFWFWDQKPHLYLQILSRCLSSSHGRTIPLSLWVWCPSSCRFSGTLEEGNRTK